MSVPPVSSRPSPPCSQVGALRSRRVLVPAALVSAVAVALVVVPADLGQPARAALLAFGLALVLWTTTPLPAAWVSLVAVLVLVALGGAEQEEVYESLGAAVVWLVIGAFVLGGAVTRSGLGDRMVAAVVGRAGTVGGLLWAVTALLVPLSAVVPSTSGRASLVLPLHRAVSEQVGDRRVVRALALLVPSVVLVSTVSTLVGAGSHLVVEDLLSEQTDEGISFGRWLLWGAPFGVVASVLTCWVVGRTLLDLPRRRTPVRVPTTVARTWSAAERRTALVATTMVASWCTEPVHGVEIAVVAVAGVAVLTAPGVGVLGWRDAVDDVAWNLVVFVGAALVLGEAVLETGAALWLVDLFFAAAGVDARTPPLVVLVVLAVVTLTSHLYLTSHAARAAALVPPVLLFAQQTGIDPTAAVFVATVGMDYCLTMPVCSKALLMYAELDDHPLEPRDLLRLSAVMLPAHLVLVVVFYLGYWQHVGLAL